MYLDKFLNMVSAWFANNRALGGLIGFFIMDVLADIVHGVGFRNVASDRLRRVIAYIAAILIAHQLDYMFANDLFHWQYQSRFLVTLYLAGREALKLLDYISKEGIDIPVLRYRIKKMMEIEAGDESVEEIRRLAAELRSLRETRTTPQQPDPPPPGAASGPTI